MASLIISGDVYTLINGQWSGRDSGVVNNLESETLALSLDAPLYSPDWDCYYVTEISKNSGVTFLSCDQPESSMGIDY